MSINYDPVARKAIVWIIEHIQGKSDVDLSATKDKLIDLYHDECKSERERTRSRKLAIGLMVFTAVFIPLEIFIILPFLSRF